MAKKLTWQQAVDGAWESVYENGWRMRVFAWRAANDNSWHWTFARAGRRRG